MLIWLRAAIVLLVTRLDRLVRLTRDVLNASRPSRLTSSRGEALDQRAQGVRWQNRAIRLPSLTRPPERCAEEAETSQ
jgi:hypothetical protein